MASKGIQGITIQFGGDTSGLDKALKSVEQGANKAKSELKEIDRAMKSTPDSAVLWSQKQEVLNKALEESKKKLEILQNAQAEVEKQFKDKKIDDGQYRAFQRELENARAQVGYFQSEIDGMTKSTDDAARSQEDLKNSTDDTTKSQEDLKDSTDDASDSMDDLGEATENTGEKADKSSKGGFAVLAGAIAAVSGAAVTAIKTSDELSQAYDTLVKKTGASGEMLLELKTNANNVFTELPTSIDSAVTAIGEVNTRFAATDEALEKLSEKFIKFAEINDTDLNNSIGTVDKIMEQWGIGIEDIDGLLGIMTSKAQATGISTDALMNSVQDNGAVFKELGLGLDESINLLAQFEANGVNADTAIAGLRKGIKSAVSDGKSLSEAIEVTVSDIKNASSETEALAAAQELFGAKGAAEMANAIREGRFDLSELSEDMSEYKNVVSDTYESTISPIESLKTVGNRAKIIVGSVGDEIIKSLLPTAEKLLPKINNGAESLVKNLPKIVDTAKKMLPVVKGIGAGLGAWKIAETVGKGVGAVKNLTGALQGVATGASVFSAFTPAGAAALAVSGITAAVVGLCEAQKDEKTIAEEVAEKYAEQFEAAQNSHEEINKMKDDFTSRAGEIEDEAKRTEALWKELDNLTDATGRVKDADKVRADYLINELNEALGTEYTMTGNQIKNYEELSEQIDTVIGKKKAEAYLDEYLAMSSEMAQQKADNFAAYEESKKALQKAQSDKIFAAQAFRINTGYNIDEVDESYAESNEYYQAYMKADAEIKNAEALMEQDKANYLASVEYFNKLDEAERALSENRLDDVEEILFTQKDANKDIVEDENASLQEREKAFRDYTQKIRTDMELVKEANSQAEWDSLFAAMQEYVTAGQIFGADPTEIFTEEFSNGIKEMAEKGFDISGFVDWAKDSGIKTSEVFGDEYYDVMQAQLDAGYDISGLAEWGRSSGIDISKAFGDDYYSSVQAQLDNGYNIDALLQWGAASGLDISKLFTEEFTRKYQETIDMGFDTTGMEKWAIECGYNLGDVFAVNFRERFSEYTQYLYDEEKSGNHLIVRNSVNSYSDAVALGLVAPLMAEGGTLHKGAAIVAEAGPELIQVMQNGVQVTPLTETARNNALQGGNKIYNCYYTVNVQQVSGGYDITRIAQELSAEQRRIEIGRGG